jgi:RHS repeat-associated protein
MIYQWERATETITDFIFLGDELVAEAQVAMGTGSQNLNNTNVGYTGHQWDNDSGLNYMQARYYDPVIGRFYSNDPVGFRDIHSFNRYVYANNNPHKYIDPNGMAPAPKVRTNPVSSPPPIITPAGLPSSGGTWFPSGKNRSRSDTDRSSRSRNRTRTDRAGNSVFNESTGGSSKNGDETNKKGKDNKPKSSLPRDESGNYLPDPEATGPHTTLGTRPGRQGEYTQGATFDEDGNFEGRTDVTDHGRPSNHESPHFHPATGPNSVGSGQKIEDK